MFSTSIRKYHDFRPHPPAPLSRFGRAGSQKSEIPVPPLPLRERGLGGEGCLDSRPGLEPLLLETVQPEIEQAVDGLRRAGDLTRLPLGLLTRAWLLSALGDPSAARADLDEAEEIARRGPMPLFLADAAILRARLFRDRDALTEARRLVDQYGYGRRVGEVEDLEEASAGW